MRQVPDVAARDARAWALKARCDAAWSTDPGQVAPAAAELRALARRARAQPQAEVHALADWCDGIAHLARGAPGRADRALQRAAARFTARGDPLHAAQTQVARVMALALQGRFEQALACGQAAQAVFIAAGDLRAAAKISLNLGSLSLQRDAYDDAVAQYRVAVVRFARVGDREHSVMADVGLADALAFRGDSDEAARIYDRAAMRARAHALPVLAASAGHGRALLDLALGRYREALAGLERSRQAFEALQAQHLQIEAEVTLADAYLELRLLPEAVALYRDLGGRLTEADAEATLAWSQARLARAQALLGDRAAALGTLAEAAGRFAAQHNRVGLAAAALVRSELLEAGGDAAQALELACRAERDLRQSGSAEMLPLARLRVAEARLALGEADAAVAGCAALARDPGSARVRARALATRAAALFARRPASARRALERAIDAADEVRAALPGDDLRRAYLADATRPYRQRLQLALDDAEAEPARNPEVLHWLERFKARALAERLGREAPPRPADAAERDALRARLDQLYRRLRQRLEAPDGEPTQALREQAVRIEQALLERARRGQLAAGTGVAAARPAPALAAAVLAGLGAGRALVEYGIAGDELFALVASGGRWYLRRRLASAAALGAAVRAARLQIETPRAGAALAAAHAPLLLARARQRLEALHARVWAPLADLLGAAERVLLVPHGPLHAVPFAALGPGGAALVERHEICHFASAEVALAGMAGDLPPPSRALLVGHGGAGAQVEAEIAALAALFPGSGLLTGEAATVAALRRQAAQAELLHLACHGEFRGDSPLYSALHLADGTLTAAEIEQLPLSAGLVVLSACETALGDAGAGDEGVGLVRAFLIAGAARVLGSLWQVEDGDTAAFMQRFHAAWRAEGCAVAALRRAQLEQRERQPHPFHWAAFTLHGGGREPVKT